MSFVSNRLKNKHCNQQNFSKSARSWWCSSVDFFSPHHGVCYHTLLYRGVINCDAKWRHPIFFFSLSLSLIWSRDVHCPVLQRLKLLVDSVPQRCWRRWVRLCSPPALRVLHAALRKSRWARWPLPLWPPHCHEMPAELYSNFYCCGLALVCFKLQAFHN